MKAYSSITLMILLMVFVLSCDEISPPYLENSQSEDTSSYQQKILLEEYTGFRCGNCPLAAEKAHLLREKYPRNLILLTIHAGGYAKPTKEHPYDFRTTICTELDNFFGCSKAGNPNGMVNRYGFPNKTHILREGQWEPMILTLLKNKPKLNIKLTTAYNATLRKISAFVEIKFLENSSTNYHLCLYIAEDSVVQYQRDDRKTPPDVEDYVHNNVLRGGITSTWGDKISDAPIEAETIIQKQYEYILPNDKDWRPEKLKIIAFVHDKDNSFEILQV
ncbi:MAG: Omp28-related outer membrane protein, partial [Candidatus Kapaibacteriota bacterium]